MSLMSSLYIGVSGLRTSQNSLNTTAHNLANVGTTGYVRQQVVQSDSRYIKWGVTHLSTLQSGLGVDIETVRQVRDVFLDKAYRQEVGRQGFYEVQYEAVQEVESMYGELEGVAFQNSMSDLWTSLQELSKTPSLIETRSTVVQNAESFLERAEAIQDQLKKYQINLNTQIQDKVDRVNEIADEIYNLNNKISRYESNGLEHANDLRDERNNLLDELGQIISITYKEDSNGVVTVNAEGVPLVTESNTFEMGTAKVSDSSDLLKPVWTDFNNADVFNLENEATSKNDTDVGSLKGLLVCRGDDTANYTDMLLSQDEYNSTINTSVIMTVQAQFDQLIHGVVTAINDILCPNKEITLADGTKMTVLDEENAPAGMDSNHTMGEALFERKSMERYETVNVMVKVVDPITGAVTSEPKTVKKYNAEDKDNNYSLYTLGELEINKDIKSNYSLIPISSNAGTGDVDQKVAEALVTKWKEPFATISPNTLTKNNFSDYYTSFIGELATRGEELNSISTNQATLASNIDDQRQQVAGVSSDEELTNLIKFQHAYNASSRYINVIDEMLEHIISTLGR
ncbi:flagellar hook-associated protein FlgK [Anaerocolumna sedimenticola]|uniref:Flagellar hook-associated protein 1 n=1 Tax=Anaerocolumna sedimenticola TaxID=2696063 RepID=A0A6P1TL78_9FIRM|nr:flagellar hook-associated protein FlgK [Anaerocolumna sedimenticola]QHQ60666.1 flagellar hook-associated protein FlgK [Anaerocolumna sedimenticola]